MEVQGTNLVLYSYEEPDNVVDLEGAMGGYLPLTDLQDSSYQTVYQHVVSHFPILTHKQVESVRYQMVAGVNYLIEFTHYPFSYDVYLVVVHLPLSGQSPQVQTIHKNGVDISNTIVSNSLALPGAFNYEADSHFR